MNHRLCTFVGRSKWKLDLEAWKLRTDLLEIELIFFYFGCPYSQSVSILEEFLSWVKISALKRVISSV